MNFMALIKCPECGKMISQHATSCPNCGYPHDFFYKTAKIKKEKKLNPEKITLLIDLYRKVEKDVVDPRRIEENINYGRQYFKNINLWIEFVQEAIDYLYSTKEDIIKEWESNNASVYDFPREEYLSQENRNNPLYNKYLKLCPELSKNDAYHFVDKLTHDITWCMCKTNIDWYKLCTCSKCTLEEEMKSLFYKGLNPFTCKYLLSNMKYVKYPDYLDEQIDNFIKCVNEAPKKDEEEILKPLYEKIQAYEAELRKIKKLKNIIE